MTGYEDLVTVRQLHAHERSAAGAGAAVPLVIEPKERSDVNFLSSAFGEHSEAVKRSIFEHGAILIRGFQVHDARDFERLVLSVRGFRAMSGYFMKEKGRDLVPGTKHVFETNTIFKTGGEWRFGGFHCENYYTLDVPHIQAFCCFKAPWLGGETALVHMANAYREFDEDLKARLEATPCKVKAFPLDNVAAHYELPEETVERFFARERIDTIVVKDDGNRKWIVCYKPSVYVHPYTKKASLQVNLSVELPEINNMTFEHFSVAYQSYQWCLHRLAWRHPTVRNGLSYLSHLPRAFNQPTLFGAFIMEPIRKRAAALVKRQPTPPKRATPRPGARLKRILEPRHVRSLADAVWRHSSAFTWRAGDVLVFDNLQMLHAGMPGFGPRLLRVMMCNPVPIPYPLDKGITGVGSVVDVERHRSFHERLVDLGGGGA
jgi:alpha-ketoglutarate-dependent taurine dioxygenase